MRKKHLSAATVAAILFQTPDRPMTYRDEEKFKDPMACFRRHAAAPDRSVNAAVRELTRTGLSGEHIDQILAILEDCVVETVKSDFPDCDRAHLGAWRLLSTDHFLLIDQAAFAMNSRREAACRENFTAKLAQSPNLLERPARNRQKHEHALRAA